MRNGNGKTLGKTAEIAMFLASNMVSNYLNLLAIPAGFEPATIGLEGPKPSPEICGFAAFQTVNRTRQNTYEFASAVNGEKPWLGRFCTTLKTCATIGTVARWTTPS